MTNADSDSRTMAAAGLAAAPYAAALHQHSVKAELQVLSGAPVAATSAAIVYAQQQVRMDHKAAATMHAATVIADVL
jgi:hypothetical protein